jgi:hypothetical protein
VTEAEDTAMRPAAGTDSHHHHHHDHHGLHQGSGPVPWFVLAVVAFVAAVMVGCSGDANNGSTGAPSGVDAHGAAVDASIPLTPSSPTPTTEANDIFDTDFLGACDGVGFAGAAAYEPTPGVIHPVVVLAGQGTEMYGRTGAVREAWTRAWATENTRAMSEIQLVLCAEKQSSTKVQDCTGYQVDGVDTDHVVHLNEVVYAVSLHVAQTGAELASTSITARDDECPMLVSFSDGETTAEQDSFDDLAVQAFVEPYVAP